MGYDTANIFKMVKAEAIAAYGNTFIVYDKNGNLLPHEFTALLETKFYKEYVRRLAKTQADVSYLQKDYYVANKQTPLQKMLVWGWEEQFIQNQRISTIIYLTSVADPIERMVQHAHGG